MTRALGRAVVLRGDAAHLPLPDASVDLIVTSPPYFSLRDYRDADGSLEEQIGSEATPQEYLEALWTCTREWARVLKPTGSMWINLGDKYAGGGGQWDKDECPDPGRRRAVSGKIASGGETYGLRAKSLLGIPWRYAIGCIDELGLILRRDQIWYKPSGLPESVTDRCATKHEYLFHLTKRPQYYSALDEIREPLAAKSLTHRGGGQSWGNERNPDNNWGDAKTRRPDPLGKIPGSVWEIAAEPLRAPEFMAVGPGTTGPGGVDWLMTERDAWAWMRRHGVFSSRVGRDDSRTELRKAPEHFAAFPPRLVDRIIGGWSPPGICVECGEGRRPTAAGGGYDPQALARRGTASQDYSHRTASGRPSPLLSVNLSGPEKNRYRIPHRIAGYVCACPEPNAPTRPAVVLDPFGGTGTTALVARALGRIGITVDRSGDYCRLAAWRTSDPAQLAKVLGVRKPPVQNVGQDALFEGDDVA